MSPPPESTVEPPAGGAFRAGSSPSEPGQAVAVGDTLGRYRLLKKIARGGMAEVFAARSFGAHGFEKTVAIKRILPRYGNDPQFVRMMVDEAKITVLLNHANVATILELCALDGDYFIVMEFVAGQSLSIVAKKLREGGERLGILESCFVVVELLQGLHAAHVQTDQSGKLAHIVHRDVSPQNVLVNFDGHVKVIDFGIARAKHRLERTEIGTIKGKLRYLAPEMIDPGRFMKSGDFDHRVDVFAAGIVLWELIANRSLYQGDDEIAVYDAITESDAPDLHRLTMCDAALAKIVAKALVRQPDSRYLSAEEFADDLRAYLYRSDPAFTHKRIAAVMQRLFPDEQDEMLALERGSSPQQVGEQKAAAPPQRVPLPVSADAATRTQHSGASGARLDVARDPSSPTVQPLATQKMRSGESSKKPSGVLHAKAIPLEDGDLHFGPAQGEVLTVMTLVSRSGGARTAPATQDVSLRDLHEFSDREPTMTVSDGPKLPRADRQGSAIDERAQATARVPSISRTLRPVQGSVRLRRLLLAAAFGIAIALVAVVGFELLARAPQESATPLAPPPAMAITPLRLVVTSAAPSATVVVAGEERAAPATFMVLPGDSVPVVVRAPFYAEKIERVIVPRSRDGSRPSDQVLDVSLEPSPVSLTVTVTPKDALVQVGAEPYRSGMTVKPGQLLMLQVSAPGFAAVRREIAPRPGQAIVEDIVLVEQVVAKAPSKRTGSAVRPQTKQAASLTIKTRPVWGEVTIDGLKYEETTPLQVWLAPGKHTVVVTHPPKGLKQSFSITLMPGQSETRTVRFEETP